MGRVFGLVGFRRSFMPASSGVRLPFRSLHAWQEVVVVELVHLLLHAAVLATKAVARVDVDAGEAHRVLLREASLGQADDGRRLERHPTERLVVLLDDLGLAKD